MNDSLETPGTVIITGAAGGLGRELSFVFATNGNFVVGLNRSAESGRDLAAEFRSRGLEGAFLQQDITVEGDWPEFESLIESRRGSAFTLILNAAVPFSPMPFHLTDWRQFEEQLDVAVKGSYLVLKRLIPSLASSRQGTVITVLTTALDQPVKGFSVYTTAKAALGELTRSAAEELSPRGVRFFSVSPGFMETALTHGWSDHLKAMVLAGSNSRSPAEYARAIANLARDNGVPGKGENYVLYEEP